MIPASRGASKDAVRKRNRWYINWSTHRSPSTLVLQTVPSAENDQYHDRRQQPRWQLMTPFLPTLRVVRFNAERTPAVERLDPTVGWRTPDF